MFRCYLQDADRTACKGVQKHAALPGLAWRLRHQLLLVLGQPEPATLEVFQLCLGLMLKTVQSRNEKGEPTLSPPRDQTLLFQSTHFGGREAGDHLAI